jgi:hypothetical protein
LPKRCVPPDDLNKTRHAFECRICVGFHMHPGSERRASPTAAEETDGAQEG